MNGWRWEVLLIQDGGRKEINWRHR